MKSPLSIIAAFCAILLAGCYSMDVASNEALRKSGTTDGTGNEQIEHVLVSNYGWYLFNCIPIACGNTNTDPRLPWVIFRNDVTMEKIQSRFMAYVNGMKKNVKDLAYTSYDSVMLEIPGSNIPVPIPYLLTYRELQLSGVLTDRKEAAE